MTKFSKLFLALTATASVASAAAFSFSKKAEVSTSAATDYYSSITSSIVDQGGNTLRDALNSLNNQKRTKTMGYKNHRNWFQYTEIDPKGEIPKGKMLGFYDNALVSDTWDNQATWNHEHVWPKSKGGDKVEGDIHMVRPAGKQTNGDRGNMYYASDVYDPGQFVAEYRGIAARIIFYCAIADTSLKIVDAKTGGSNEMGKLSDLLKWNLEYLPNTSMDAPLALRVEQNRNNVIATKSGLQGNRNPFIDHPEYACKIWGNTNETTKSICKNNTSGTGGGNTDDGGDDKPVVTKVQHTGTEADPYSVTNAIAQVGKDQNEHYVVGIVDGSVSTGTSGDIRFNLADDENIMHVYYIKTNGLATPKSGDYVVVKGKLVDYEGTPEIAEGGTLVSVSNSYPSGWKLNEDGTSGGGNDDDDGGNTGGKKGCGGSVVAASSILFLTSLGGFMLLVKKRKEDK